MRGSLLFEELASELRKVRPWGDVIKNRNLINKGEGV